MISDELVIRFVIDYCHLGLGTFVILVRALHLVIVLAQFATESFDQLNFFFSCFFQQRSEGIFKEVTCIKLNKRSAFLFFLRRSVVCRFGL